MSAPPQPSRLLDAVLNLSRFHREHEKFYASAPRHHDGLRVDRAAPHSPLRRARTSGGNAGSAASPLIRGGKIHPKRHERGHWLARTPLGVWRNVPLL
jgi:hypothetical protein